MLLLRLRLLLAAAIGLLAVPVFAQDSWWHSGTIEAVRVSSTSVRIRLNPSPQDRCGGNTFYAKYPLVTLPGLAEADQKVYRDRATILLSEAMSRHARVSVWMTRQAYSDGTGYCTISNVQVWKPNDVVAAIRDVAEAVRDGNGNGNNNGDGNGNSGHYRNATHGVVTFARKIFGGQIIAWAIHWGRTADEAERNARELCESYLPEELPVVNVNYCDPILRFGGDRAACGALAMKDGGASYGMGRADTLVAAQNYAITNCNGEGSGCSLATSDDGRLSSICLTGTSSGEAHPTIMVDELGPPFP